jgi:carbonic anhydrase/acetyltransferase-like protein (isoleucine patch superfamily)
MKRMIVFGTVFGVFGMCATGALALEKERSLVLDARSKGKPAGVSNETAIGNLAVAGRLSVDLHAEFMASRSYGTEAVLNWYNCGYSGGGGEGRASMTGGAFGDFGFQVPYTEREKRYPHAVTVDKVRALYFDGDDFLKGNFAVESKIAGARPLALEVWFRCASDPQGAVLLGWQARNGVETSGALALPSEIKGSSKWRHLVVNCTADKEDWYLDGSRISGGKRTMLIQPGHVMVLGGASAKQPSFKGDLAAVRLHDEAMTGEEIAHNCAGGVMLGTELHNWWRMEPDKWHVVESAHFRHAVDKEEMKKWDARWLKEFPERTPGMFRMAELCYHLYSERLAMRSSVVSRRAEMRGDGIKYKTPIQPSHGSWMGVDDDFGWSCQGAGSINPHELVHGWQAQTGGMAGNYWEAHANFPQTYGGIYQTSPVGSVWTSHLYPANGRTYYGERSMFEHLAQTPEYGPMFISKLWYDGPAMVGENPLPWIAFNRVNPLPERTLADEWTRMAMRNITWDYVTFEEARDGLNGNTPYGNDGVVSKENIYRKEWSQPNDRHMRHGRAILESISYEPGWWRVPKSQAPQQLGYNICPLKIKQGKVSATLAGYLDEARGGNWRAGFVGVDSTGKPVYGEVFGPGKTQAFEVSGDVKELYLVVCATPSKLMDMGSGDFNAPDQEPFPYKVKLQGCEPMAVLPPAKPDVPGKAHVNGGGFVAETAKVEATAYVGPNARVLDRAVVSGKARIADYAIICSEAKVMDEAIVSGNARIAGSATVAGNAKVCDYAVILNQTKVSGHAQVREHATIDTQKECTDHVTVKGCAYVYGGRQSGTAMIDGFYAKGQDITRGKWFTWSWGGGKNPGEIDKDFGGLYAAYEFDTPHGWMASDSFGATWGYLVNGAKVEIMKGRMKYKPEAILETLASQENIGENYCQSLRGYLFPPVTGDYTFSIEADDMGEFWLGKAGSTNVDQKTSFFSIASPSKTSAVVHLEKGKVYPFTALHAESHGGDYISVFWVKPGSAKKEIIEGTALSVTPDGRYPGVCQRLWKGVSNLTELVKRPDYPEGNPLMEEGVLSLNGKDQFVELQRNIANMRDVSIKARVMWLGGRDERIFEFSNNRGDFAYLTPSSGRRCEFVIRVGTTEHRLSGPALTSGKWTDVMVTFQGPVATLVIDGKMAAEINDAKLQLEDVAATQCWLGRGLNGKYFKGMIDCFQVYCVSLVDKQPPVPNPPTWAQSPMAISGSSLVLRATKGNDDSPLEYRFMDVSKQFDSGWQASQHWVATHLIPGKTYRVALAMRDKAGNMTKPSEPVDVTMPTSLRSLVSCTGGVSVVDALVGDTTEAAGRLWKMKPNGKFPGGKALETDDRGWTATVEDVLEAQSPRVDYRVNFAKAGKYFMTARCFSPHGGNCSIFAGMDFTSNPVLVGFEPGKAVWCRPIELDIGAPGTHLVQLWAAQDGAAVDRLVIAETPDRLPKGTDPEPTP